MLLLRNRYIFRSVYLQLLSIASRLIYGRDPERTQAKDRAAQLANAVKIKKVNSALEFGGIGEWEGIFYEAADHRQTERKDLIFDFPDSFTFLSEAADALVGDSLSRCFSSEPPKPWNFLTRNCSQVPLLLIPLWIASLWIRYLVLLPLRLAILCFGIFLFLTLFILVGFVIPRGDWRSSFEQRLLRFLASVFLASWSGVVRFHGRRPERKANQIYVANHTSLIDIIVLYKDYTFSIIGQRHGGFAGILQDLLMRVQNHIWFDREVGRDRHIVQELLREHVRNPNNEPMLVFPEGTCVNNEYCIMFKKGSFELGAQVVPIAIKYNKRYANPYWDSSQCGFLRHVWDLMTSWAVVVDVYYLEPMKREPNETASEFAKRVKRAIVHRIGLIDVEWDGFLKRHRISSKFIQQRQKAHAMVLLRRMQRNCIISDSYPLEWKETAFDSSVDLSSLSTASHLPKMRKRKSEKTRIKYNEEENKTNSTSAENKETFMKESSSFTSSQENGKEQLDLDDPFDEIEGRGYKVWVDGVFLLVIMLCIVFCTILSCILFFKYTSWSGITDWKWNVLFK
ncbi:Glycerol-3-phosphate acyltransferase 4 [Galdieria sulphuraria]|uniref:Phospholipid/glycerol acyltransferase family protein n=1 Tax=Galdieria sulphuraria TaxID=130081 RepID=M2XSJ5_GALSU|nr:phospholipid/glycerol acyltransferase family protein [Galdieria sulphuraria]EME26369.1 phospholipid/glycerol acyltransferase family protein [Galdieria sulphuraria]GJD11670.1 Glycerol-3-phosphate acyltransferase 4 [Galdieria sulphuraria]|eukprot:XP_005702889.1 phospholipid/glycerol acyltransferase family protein [Galdieria sulphuraria]